MDREKVIKGLECCKNKTMLWQHDQCPYHGLDEDCESNLHADALALLKKQEEQKFFVDKSGKITPLPVVVRCKDCTKRYTRFCPDVDSPTRADDWFCADGERKDI